MSDGTGQTSYDYDDLYRLTEVTNGAGQTIGYEYDAAGNRTRLTYPLEHGGVVTYTYDNGNRLETVTDWRNGQFGYDYDDANRLAGVTLPNGVASSYGYDDAGRLTLLSHHTITESLATYNYALDNVGNRTILTETLLAIQPISAGAYLESEGLVVVEAENGQTMNNEQLTMNKWVTATKQSGYTGTAYLQVLPDTDKLYQTDEITSSPAVQYPVFFTTPGTYAVWSRAYAKPAFIERLQVSRRLTSQPVQSGNLWWRCARYRNADTWLVD